jgi:hypothetical protein
MTSGGRSPTKAPTIEDLREAVRLELEAASKFFAPRVAANEAQSVATQNLPENARHDLKLRNDVLGFLDALTAGAIALGVTKFVELLEPLIKTGSAHEARVTIFWAAIPFVTALFIAFEDFRHARSLNAEYGLRLQDRKWTPRYWIECGVAVTMFFLVSESFVNPVQFLFWLGMVYILGFLWALSLCWDLSKFAKGGKYPSNSLSLTIDEVKCQADEQWPFSLPLGDYRIAFVVITHLVCALVYFMLSYLLSGMADVTSLRITAFNRLTDPTETSIYISREVSGLVSLFVFTLFVVMKWYYAARRSIWHKRLQRLRTPSTATSNAVKEA